MSKNNQDYFITLILLCSYGFFAQTRPSEPYKIDYLTDPQFKNLNDGPDIEQTSKPFVSLH